MKYSSLKVLFWQIAILVVTFVIWEWGFDLRKISALRPVVPTLLDPYFISKPSAIWTSFLKLGCFADKAGPLAGDHRHLEEHVLGFHRWHDFRRRDGSAPWPL